MNRKLLTLGTLFFFTFFRLSAQTYELTGTGVKAKINSVNIELQFYNSQIIRVIKSPDTVAYEKNSLSVILTPQKVDLKVIVDDGLLKVSSATLSARINLTNGQISFYNLSGELIFKEKTDGAEFEAARDGNRKTFKVSQVFTLGDEEAIYGLGQHQDGKMNQRNQHLVLKQENMQIAVPLFHSVKGYAVLWDNNATTTFNDNKFGASFESEVGDGIDYYMINGSGKADNVIANYRALTGQVPMFPRWIFGFWQSRERYKSQYQLVDVVKRYRALKVPLDGIVQDWQYWGVDNQYWNSTEFGNPLFPNPKAMVDSVHLLHAHIIISVWPSFGNKTKIYKELKDSNLLFNFTTWPITSDVQPYDTFDPKARSIFWSYMSKNMFKIGIDGWWLDSTEPDQMRPKPGDEDSPTPLGTFRSVRNAFPLVHTGGVYDHQRKESAAKRVFILARSAYAGQQRYGTMIWSGDVQSRWDVLRKQISGGLNLSMSGIPYWTTDIGGFFPRGKYPKGVKDPAFQELYVRWFQFSTFCPMFRSHGEFTPREIYQFGAKGYWAYDAQVKFINLRYRLLPYNYSNAWSISSKASTMMRALVMDFPKDSKVYDIDNEYLLGKSFLVSPVTDSLYTSRATGNTVSDFSKVKTQKVYLPEGTAWFDFWTGKTFTGGQWIEKQVPIDIMPLYVKAGAVIPMGPLLQYTAEKKSDPLEIRVYPGADGSFELYEDENDNYNYEKGAYSLIRLVWSNTSKTLTIENRKGVFKGMLNERNFNITLVNEQHGTGADVVLHPSKSVKYSGKMITVKL